MYKCQNQTEMTENCKKTNLLVQIARSAVQKFQITVDSVNSQQTTSSVSYIKVA